MKKYSSLLLSSYQSVKALRTFCIHTTSLGIRNKEKISPLSAENTCEGAHWCKAACNEAAMGSIIRGLEVRRIERFPWDHRILQSTQEPKKTKE